MMSKLLFLVLYRYFDINFASLVFLGGTLFFYGLASIVNILTIVGITLFIFNINVIAGKYKDFKNFLILNRNLRKLGNTIKIGSDIDNEMKDLEIVEEYIVWGEVQILRVELLTKKYLNLLLQKLLVVIEKYNLKLVLDIFVDFLNLVKHVFYFFVEYVFIVVVTFMKEFDANKIIINKLRKYAKIYNYHNSESIVPKPKIENINKVVTSVNNVVDAISNKFGKKK